MDEHTIGEEKALATEGEVVVSKEELKEMGEPAEIDYPMPGEVATEEEEAGHMHSMPEDATFIGEDGKEV